MKKFRVICEYYTEYSKVPSRTTWMVDLPKWNATEAKKIIKGNQKSSHITKVTIIEYKEI